MEMRIWRRGYIRCRFVKFIALLLLMTWEEKSGREHLASKGKHRVAHRFLGSSIRSLNSTPEQIENFDLVIPLAAPCSCVVLGGDFPSEYEFFLRMASSHSAGKV